MLSRDLSSLEMKFIREIESGMRDKSCTRFRPKAEFFSFESDTNKIPHTNYHIETDKKFTIVFDHGVLEIEYNREERRWIANSLGYTFKDIVEMTSILGFIESKILLFNIKQEEKENG